MASDGPAWNPDFLDLLECLREAHADFLVVGAFALAENGLPPRRIDLLTQLSGIDFDEGWASRIERLVGSTSVAFLGRDALIKTKRASARPKDLADVAGLEALAAKR